MRRVWRFLATHPAAVLAAVPILGGLVMFHG